jgi:hypothetical protein
MVRGLLIFLAGGIVGVYAAQNYELPNIKQKIDDIRKRFQEEEVKRRKPDS